MFGFFICIAIILYVCAMAIMMFVLSYDADIDFPLQFIGAIFWPISVWIICIIIIVKYKN